MSERESHEQALLAEIPWLRQLARELVRDVHAGEDLVQEACRIAWSKPPRHVGRASLRAWLRSVVRNAHWSGRRSAQRAALRERDSARGEAIEGVDELVARAELQRRLLALVLSLREPLRAVLVLRYYRGLGTTEIAARLECSEDAVRQRQARGLAELREVTRDDGELRDLLALTGFFPKVARGAERTLRWSAAACLMVVAACLAPRLAGGLPSGSERGPIAPAPSTNGAVVAGSDSRESTESARSLPVGPVALAPWLVVCVRDARSQEPIAGATIARARAKGWQELANDVDASFARLGIAGSAGNYLSLSHEEALPPEPGSEDAPPFAPRDETVIATTDREGRAGLGTKLPEQEFLLIRCAGRGARYFAVADAEKLADAELAVDLHPTGKLSARVHTIEGEAIDGAFLRLEAVPFLPEYRPQLALPLVDGLAWSGPTDEQGRFELADVPLDEALVVTPLSRCIGKATSVLLPAGADPRPLDLVVVAPGSICGRFVDERGRAIVDAPVGSTPRRPWYYSGSMSRTDSEGFFQLSNLPAGLEELGCWPDHPGGYLDATTKRFPVIVEPFSKIDVGELVYDRGVACSGRVIGWEEPWQSQCWIELLQKGNRGSQSFGNRGTFDLRGEPGPAMITVNLQAGWMRSPIFMRRSVVLPCQDIELDVGSVLASLRFRLGNAPGEKLSFSAHFYDRAQDSGDGTLDWESVQCFDDVQGVDGAFQLGALVPGRYRMELQDSTDRLAWTGEVILVAGKSLDLGTLELGTGCIAGSILGAPAGTEVSVVRRVPAMPRSHRKEEFDRRRMPLGADGSFVFPALPAGLWCVSAASGVMESTQGSLVDLRVGDTEHLELPMSRPASIRCHVRQGDVPVAGAVASSSFALVDTMRPFFELNPRSKVLPSDHEGRIELGAFHPGRYRVSIEAGQTSKEREVGVAWGEELELDFDLGAPEFRISLDLPEAWMPHLFGLQFHPCDASGAPTGESVRSTCIDPNTFALRAAPARGSVELYFDFHWGQSIQLPLELREGQREQTLRLPAGEIAVRLGASEEGGGLPSLSVTELPGARIAPTLARSAWPLEQLPDGRWLARGIPDGAKVRLQEADPRTIVGHPTKVVQFESGRLEVSWP